MTEAVLLHKDLGESMRMVNEEIRTTLANNQICLIRVIPEGHKPFGLFIMKKKDTPHVYMWDGGSRLTRSDNPYISLLNYGREFHSEIMEQGQHPIGIDVEESLPNIWLKKMKRVLNKTHL